MIVPPKGRVDMKLSDELKLPTYDELMARLGSLDFSVKQVMRSVCDSCVLTNRELVLEKYPDVSVGKTDMTSIRVINGVLANSGINLNNVTQAEMELLLIGLNNAFEFDESSTLVDRHNRVCQLFITRMV